ncbi:MAG TPA: DUF2127 domain-containing protein [Terracidiphilus sp.]|jgi:uncharacterized membrane protein (DUF2068 family)|nr:DUF2127 domain-containing protein [Terracidiphilus sp.]
MIDTQAPLDTRRQHNKLLILIAVYKGLQALLFAAVGVGALRLLHQDIGDILDNLREALHFSPESRFVNFILDKASLVDDPMLRRIGFVAFSYAAVSFAEGIGLYLEKAWGELLTLIITASFLPWEIFEVLHHVTWLRVGLLLINTLVLLYLLKIVASRRKTSIEADNPAADPAQSAKPAKPAQDSHLA